MPKTLITIFFTSLVFWFLWFEARPTYFRIRCAQRAENYILSNFKPENIMAQKAAHIDIENDRYMSCMRHWGLKE